MVCIFFKYLLGTFHVLKTLASLKISKAFLFKYSMCVGGSPSFLICLYGTLRLLVKSKSKKQNNQGDIQFSFIGQLLQLQKRFIPLKLTKESVS